MGPTKFQGFQFNNDDKSLIQLSKFNDEYDLIFEMLKSNEKIVIILDRTSFGEFIWTKYWDRTGKYTQNRLAVQIILNMPKIGKI